MHNTLKSHYYPNLIEARHDETGRGCLAGNVFVAAVILPSNCDNVNLNNSKQLSRKKRDALRQAIINDAVAWAVGEVTSQEIDEINILYASFLAMRRALDQLTTRPQAIIVDGNRLAPHRDLPYTTTIKGDGKYQNIATASILVKIFRDDYMDRLTQECPQYDWQSNMGYPTRKHWRATRAYGITPYHRYSFSLLDNVELSLDL